MKWIITANSTTCNIYEYQKHHLNCIHRINYPENKLKPSELADDRLGRYNTPTPTRGAYESHYSPVEVHIIQFVREIVDTAEKGRESNQFNELIIIMPAEINGLFNQHANKNLKRLISNTIHKNLMDLSEKELEHYVNHALKKSA